MPNNTQHSSNSRIHGYDVIRGFSVISMVLFHFCYDLAYINGLSMPWFVGTTLQNIWRASISWVFLVLAGIMCAYSRNNVKRGAKYLAVAILIWLVTSYAMPSEAISFGIIYCMAASTLITAALMWLGNKLGLKATKPLLVLAGFTCFVLFLLSLQVPWGSFGLGAFGGPTLPVPNVLYNGRLSWLGFMSSDFYSADYYPIIPYTLLFLSGASLGQIIKLHGAPAWLKDLRCAPIEFVGRHALEVYILHQPVLLLIAQFI